MWYADFLGMHIPSALATFVITNPRKIEAGFHIFFFFFRREYCFMVMLVTISVYSVHFFFFANLRGLVFAKGCQKFCEECI